MSAAAAAATLPTSTEFPMALKATIFKAELQVSDMDRHHYGSYALTVARHPSETDERMMLRLLAFALHAGDDLAFTRGLSEADEPDLWQKDLTGSIDLWVEIGLPDERRLLKACGRANAVIVYCYGGHGAQIWWNGIAQRLERARNLTVINIPQVQSKALAQIAERTMQLQCSIQEGQAWFGTTAHTIEVTPETWRTATER